MGSFNCTGFHSRLPITCGDDIFVILGLHLTAKHLVKYAFDPMIFAPGHEFTPIDRIINGCDDGEELSKAMTNVVNEKFGLPAGEYFLTFTFDHRFVYDEIASMEVPWDWEKSYEMTLEYSDLSAGLEKRRYTDSELENIFRKQSLSTGWKHAVANLNPKHVGTSLYRDNEAFMGSLLLAVYRYHSDILFCPELKQPLLGFMTFHQAMRYHNWPITLPVYAGQEERYDEIAPLYRKMAEWVEERIAKS